MSGGMICHQDVGAVTLTGLVLFTGHLTSSPSSLFPSNIDWKSSSVFCAVFKMALGSNDGVPSVM